MQAISIALTQLFEEGAWFVRAQELRLWIVRVSNNLRKPALQIITGLEFLGDNRSAWITVPDAYTTADHGWQVRANRLIAHWSIRRKAFLENEGIEMPEPTIGHAPGPEAITPSSSVEPMRNACIALSEALRPPLNGCVIVLTPATVSDVNEMGSEIEELANDPALEACRWVWLLDADEPWPDVLERFGERALCSECIPDREQQKKDLAALVAGPSTMLGRAGPQGVTPPRRITEPPAMPADELAAALRAAGINPEYCKKAPELQRLILGAAIAMGNEEREEAIRGQQEACDLASSLEMFDVTVLCRVALGSYLTACGRREEALHVLESAAALANQHGFALQEAQAHLGTGLLLALAERYEDSADAYSLGARCAEAANVPALAIEAWRMAGQTSLQAGDDPRASECFGEAIRVAEKSEIETVKESTAGESARKLASIFDRLGMPAQATSLRAQAEALESGEIGIDNLEAVEA